MSKEHEPCPYCGEQESLKLCSCTTKKKVQKGFIECENCGARGQLQYGNTDPDEFDALVWFGWDERFKDPGATS